YSKNLFGSPMDLPAESGGKGQRKEFFVPTAKMTPIQLGFMKLFRNVRIQEAFYGAALQGLQQIKYNDGQPSSRVEKLDPAVVSGSPVRPNVRTLVYAAVGSALLAGLMLALA